MATEFHMRVRRILEAALEHSTRERTRFLAQAAEGDDALLREALDMLPHFAADDAAARPPWLMRPTLFNGMAAALFDDVEQPPPFCIPPYTVVEALGRGGMGVVYRALDPLRTAQVAIKLMRRRLMTPEDRRRFQHEQELLRQLKHPGIVRFLHGGMANVTSASGKALEQRMYFVMELVQGRSLLEYATHAQLDSLSRLDLLIQLCEALHYAHHREVVHLDLKPDNIRVDANGRPRILDFGIARLQCPDANDADRARACTPAYASPEQRAGRDISPASDVYSLGVIAHELLTGRRPRRVGERVALDLSDLKLDSRGSKSRNEDFRAALHEVLSGALRLSHSGEYRNAGELEQDFTALRHSFTPSGWRTFFRRASVRSNPPAPTPTHSRLLATLLGQRLRQNMNTPRKPRP